MVDLLPPGIPPLVTMGDPRLARTSTPVPLEEISSPAFQERLRILAASMVAYEGIGIAAPQIGWFERFFLMALPEEADPADRGAGGTGAQEEEPEMMVVAWINPEIVAVSSEHCWAWEGCLSVPGLRGWIRRPAAVAVRGYAPNGEPMAMELTGWDARVFQHEFDHLDGMLFPYRAADARHLVMTEQLERLEQLEQLGQLEAWPEDWPAPGARDTPPGAILME